MSWSVNAIVGLPGSGKTLTMIFFMSVLDKKGIPFITNVLTDFENSIYIEDDEVLKVFDISKKHNVKVLFLDELWLWFDARYSMSKTSREFTKYVLQIRKYGCHLYHTLQTWTQIDIRIRRLTTYIIVPEYINDEKTNVYIIDGVTETLVKRFSFRSKDYYKHYDTNQTYFKNLNQAVKDV